MYRKTINVLTLAIVIFGFVQVSFSQDNVSSVACLDVTSESCVTELFSDYITTDQANAIRVIGWFKEIDEWINFRNELASYDDENERLLATYLFIFKRPYISVWIFGGSVFLKDKTVLQTYREIKEHYTSLFGLCMPPRLTFKIKLDWLDIFTTSPLNGAVIKMYQLSSCSSDYQYYTTLKAPTVITDFKFNRAYGAFESGTYLLTFEYKGKKVAKLVFVKPTLGQQVTIDFRKSVEKNSKSPVIAQSPMSGPPGTAFKQWGTGFTANSTATLHFSKPDGTEYPTATQSIDSNGTFSIPYNAPTNKPPGTYTWWAVDGPTEKMSNKVSYTIN